MEHLEMPRSFSFAVYGAVRNMQQGCVAVLSTTGHDVPLGYALATSISKSNNSPAIAVLTSDLTHNYYTNKIREAGPGRNQNVTLYKHATGDRKELLDTFVKEHEACVFIADLGGIPDPMNIYRTFIQTGRQSNGILIIVSPDGITPGSVDFDLIYSVGNVQLD